MSKIEDLSNKKINHWLVIKRVENNPKNNNPQWLCRCDCGTEKIILGSTLRSKRTISCGCTKPINLEGKTFGKLLVKKCLGVNHRHRGIHLCLCECGQECIITSDHLVQKNSKSCGCETVLDLTGKTFNRLTAIRFVYIKKEKRYWLCKCICGNYTEVPVGRLQNGHTQSCGCLHIDILKSRIGHLSYNWNPNLTDEDRQNAKEHRKVSNPEYISWRKQIFERDNYICQKCFEQNNQIRAHHINCWSRFKDQRFNINNGITLCKQCHKDIHKKYGQFTTLSDWNEFKSDKEIKKE